jgi:hypothetical protein
MIVGAIISVILQYKVGYKYRRIYKVLVDEEISKQIEGVPTMKLISYSANTFFLNLFLFVVGMFCALGTIVSFPSEEFIIPFTISCVSFFLLFRAIKKQDHLTNEEYRKEVERQYKLVKHLKYASKLFDM